MSSQYKSRAHQSMADIRKVRKGGMSLEEAVRCASFCGACEARSQAMDIISKCEAIPWTVRRDVQNAISNVPIMKLLGWQPRFATKGGAK